MLEGFGSMFVIQTLNDKQAKPLGYYFWYLVCFDQNVQMSNVMC